MDTLRPLVDERPVVIFSRTSTDAVSHSMKQLISRYGANPTVYEIDEMSNGKDVENALEMIGHTLNLPAIFIGGSFIGGPNEVIRTSGSRRTRAEADQCRSHLGLEQLACSDHLACCTILKDTFVFGS